VKQAAASIDAHGPSGRRFGFACLSTQIAIVIFDSTAPIGDGQAVYIDANASMVEGDELPQRCAEAFARIGPGAKRLQPRDLSGDAVLRLYRAHASGHEVHIPGRDPTYGVGVDTRRRASL
jgi:hypothetical protein